jgi:hypothetical protein
MPETCEFAENYPPAKVTCTAAVVEQYVPEPHRSWSVSPKVTVPLYSNGLFGEAGTDTITEPPATVAVKFGGKFELGLHTHPPVTPSVQNEPLAERTVTLGVPPGIPPEYGSEALHGKG